MKQTFRKQETEHKTMNLLLKNTHAHKQTHTHTHTHTHKEGGKIKKNPIIDTQWAQTKTSGKQKRKNNCFSFVFLIFRKEKFRSQDIPEEPPS